MLKISNVYRFFKWNLYAKYKVLNHLKGKSEEERMKFFLNFADVYNAFYVNSLLTLYLNNDWL